MKQKASRLLLFKKPVGYLAGQVKWGRRSVVGNRLFGKVTELVPDPEFNDPGAWSIVTQEGSAVITSGQLVCTAFRGTIRAVGMQAAVAGNNITWDVDIASAGGVGLATVQYPVPNPLYAGGEYLWLASSGAGIFTGSGIVTSNPPQYLNIAIALTADDMTINSISIKG